MDFSFLDALLKEPGEKRKRTYKSFALPNCLYSPQKRPDWLGRFLMENSIF